MWRYDAQRSAASPHALPAELHLQWVRQYPSRVPVWEDPLNQDLMPYDRVLEPVVSGGRVFLGFNDSDKIVALDAQTGEEVWRYYADGPVRFPPVVWQGKVYFASDDGFLYCLSTDKGELVWRFRGGPDGRRILGNSRLISVWPARGGPVVHEGMVYFAAGIWPFMGTFIYALDAETGAVIWLNDSDGPTFQAQPHGGSWSFGGVGPQGALVVSGDWLLVPGGRSVPAVLNRATGKVLHYQFHESGKTGGSFVCADDSVFFNHYRERVTTVYDIATGKATVRNIGKYPVLTPSTYFTSGESVAAWDAGKVKGADDQRAGAKQWETVVDASGDLIKAGTRLYAAGEGRITALELPDDGGEPVVAWTKMVTGMVERLVAAEGMLFAVTTDGLVMAFGPKPATPSQHLQLPVAVEPSGDATQTSRDILDRTGVTEGYALFYGTGDGELLQALAAGSDLDIVAFDPDAANADRLRRRLDQVGLYGKRVTVLEGDPTTSNTPPYVASLTIVTVVTGGLDSALLGRIYPSMRPYGGMAWIRGATKDVLERAITDAMPGFEVVADELITRAGPLEGAGQWTHILGDVAQTGKSRDKLARLPLGLLWFGGSSNENVLTRHGHGPPEQVVGGRLFIQGMMNLAARDVYTGRVLWDVPLYDLGTFGVYYDETYQDTPTSTRYNQVHIPGANIRGTNIVAAEDGVYVIQRGGCTVLDPATGAAKKAILLPPIDPEARRPRRPDWSYIGISGDLLIGGAGFVAYSDLLPKPKAEYSAWENYDNSASKKLLVMDRHTGEVRWEAEARHGFLNNGIVAGNGLLYCLDKLPPHFESQFARRAMPLPEDCRLVAFDIETGEKRWETSNDVFGSFLCYSEEHDILLQSTRAARDTVRGEEGKRIIAYRAKTGKVIWDRKMRYGTFPLLHGDLFLTESGHFDLKTGEPAMRPNPLTGEPMPWKWERHYGCNHPIASEHLITFRSGAAGYYDLAGASGTGSFGGFKSSCTSNLVIADGVLNAPDYTRTCSCPYPNQTSLAMVHTPDVEIWTFDEFKVGDARVQKVGVNLGAPGDRLADDGVLWLEFPLGQSPTPDLGISTAPEDVRWFLHHSSRFTGDMSWVGASGGEGLEAVTVTLAPAGADERPYTVRLFFAEPHDHVQGDERVFDVMLQGETVLDDLDVVAEAGGPRATIVKEFQGVRIGEALTVGLAPSDAARHPPILCGIEIVAEGIER